MVVQLWIMANLANAVKQFALAHYPHSAHCKTVNRKGDTLMSTPDEDRKTLRGIMERRGITGLFDMALDHTVESMFASHQAGDRFAYQMHGFNFAVLTEARLRFANRR